MTRRPARIESLDALRGVAAVAVILGHAARHIDHAFGAPALAAVFKAGHAGVDLFFVISGFVILFIHGRDIGVPARLPTYLARRFNRVWPLYWIALALTLAAILIGHNAPPGPGHVLWSATLLPSFQKPVLEVAWTLQYEALFYAVFAVLILNRSAGVVLFALWAAWIGIVAAFGVKPPAVPGLLGSAFGLQFFLGMGVAHAVLSGRVPRPRLVACLGIALFVAALVAESVGQMNGYGQAARLFYGIPAALIIAGLTAAEQAAPMAVPAPLRTLGAASYSLYLFQFIFIGPVWKLLVALGLADRLPHLALFVVLVAAAVGGGVATSRLVEKPLLRVLQSRIGPRRPAAGAA